MYTLKLRNGDLALGENGDLAVLYGARKVSRDISGWLLQELGSDRFHPWIGAALDSFVGSTGDPATLAAVRHRARELLELYYHSQTEELRRRVAAANDPTLAMRDADPRSLVRRFSEVSVTAQADEMVIFIEFETRAGDSGVSELALTRGGPAVEGDSGAELDALQKHRLPAGGAGRGEAAGGGG